ncbi:MAG: non-homologous end-joining DNA ligase, partial [Candidatus Dormibacteraeota bacterium]|nr:non-homologous end-joining DNA ligase [Candidatus Dormibacteraeota bacterium]
MPGTSGRSSSSRDLADYRRKRSFEKTPEPRGDVGEARAEELRFVIQEHHARRLHWDFRLERDGVLVSWALPKGLPTDPKRNHLAVHVEDHPLDYIDFAGRIPAGEYGAGSVGIWDRGTYETEKWQLEGGRSRPEVMVTLHGERSEGRYVLFQTDGKNWMIHRMDAATATLPERVKPMLARAVPELPKGKEDAWAFEFKWDGVRALAYCTPGEIRLQSRTGNDITRTYPEIGRLMDQVGGRSMVLDGEIVAFDDSGVPRFERIQQRLGLSADADVRTAMRRVPVFYLIFDLLHLDGKDTTGLTYLQRRELLTGLELRGKSWGVPEHQVGHGEDLLTAARERHLEGVMAKRTDSRYEPGARSGVWLKVKIRPGQELVIGGWQEGQGRRQGLPGSLLVGYYDGDAFRYAGRVGTGFTDRMLEQLQKRMKPLAQTESPFAPTRGLPRKDVHFVWPELV